nr:hypothetical protein CFP56_38859 [Quercus suber]
MLLSTNSQDGTMKGFLHTRKRVAPSRETSWLRSSNKRRKTDIGGYSSAAASSTSEAEQSGEILSHDTPRSRIHTAQEVNGSAVARRRLNAIILGFYLKRNSLRCLLDISIDVHNLKVEFRVVEGAHRAKSDQPERCTDHTRDVATTADGMGLARTVVIVKKIVDVDEERYTCRVETVVDAVVWHAKIAFDKKWVDDGLAVQWEESMSGTSTVRETIEPDVQHEIEAAFGFFRTISIIDKPSDQSVKPVYGLLVDSWNGLHSMEVKGMVVASEVVYRGDERERRLWLKLRLRLTQGASTCFLDVSGDVESDSWVQGRFSDDCPGQMFLEPGPRQDL